MSEKKIQVPEGMMKAALGANGAAFALEIGCVEQVQLALEAALRWLSDNPIGPTEQQDHELAEWSEEHLGECPFAEWQRRMFREAE